MATTITATHRPIDPIIGEQPPVVRSVKVARFDHDLNEVANALQDLFRKFHLPNGGTLVVEGYGKRIEWDYGGFLMPLARKLISFDD